MNLHAARACFLLFAVAAVAYAQRSSTRFEPLIENRQVSVFSLELPPHRQASVFQNTHDIVWIALNPGRVLVSDHDGNKLPIALRPGDARFFPSFRTTSIFNDGGEMFRGVLVEIKPRGLTSSCDCYGAAERAVCGCPRAAPLPALWAVGIGSLVLGGTTLAPGESFHRTTERGDMLLVAISPVTLSDEAAYGSSEGPSSATIALRAGEVRWLERGLHRLRNTGSAPARYVTLEF